MRFERTPLTGVSLVITKGRYKNSKGGRTNHPRKSETPVKFIGVDGEGMNVSVVLEDGRVAVEHRYVLFGVGDEQIADPAGLDWHRVFDFLYARYRPGTAYVGFFLGYDFSQILASLPEDRARMLLTSEGVALRRHRVAGKTPHPVEARTPGGSRWHMDILGNKRLRIRPKYCECVNATCHCRHKPWMYLCDAGSFFQSSFLTVVDPSSWASGTAVVTPEEFDTLRSGKSRRSEAVLDDEMRRYNALENDVLSRVMGSLAQGFQDIGIHLPPSKWFGPGQAAQAWLKSKGVPTGEQIRDVVPPWFLEAARMAYFGGWFELFAHGHIPEETHEYDINSAYPHIIRSLPCLLHGTYTRGTGVPLIRHPNALTLVYGRVWSPGMPNPSRQYVGAMLHRDTHGRILRPMATEGWYWWDELLAAESAGFVKSLKRTGRGVRQNVMSWVSYDPCDCPPPMRDVTALYEHRLKVGKGTPSGKAAKLAYNSMYGKFAQSVGEPVFGNPVYASRITSGCRTAITEAIATHPNGAADVVMVATDGVYFLTPHHGLPLGDALGAWEHKVKSNLTLFKPGVYWDDATREKIALGGSATFKARGFRASDFLASIAQVDDAFRRWDDMVTRQLSRPEIWPGVKFSSSFAMTSALQALRRNDWSQAGAVATGVALSQDSDPSSKRDGLYRDTVDARTIYRSRPHHGMADGEFIPSTPYEKRFGMEDPWSEEYQTQHGITEDGTLGEELAWILKGE